MRFTKKRDLFYQKLKKRGKLSVGKPLKTNIQSNIITLNKIKELLVNNKSNTNQQLNTRVKEFNQAR